MNRRDTIIIAVLVNAGLLLILFTTAIRTKQEQTIETKPVIYLAENQTPSAKHATPPPCDELEQVLNQYAAAPTLGDLSDEIIISANTIPSLLFEKTTPEPVPVQTSVPSIVIATPIPQVNRDKDFVNITVKKGDVLDKIARANGTTANEIMRLNQLGTTQLKIGQMLKVPLKKETSNIVMKESDLKPITIPKKVTKEEYYTIKKGDNPWLIASKNNVTLEDLLRLNNLDDQKARKLQPGDKIRIR